MFEMWIKSFCCDMRVSKKWIKGIIIANCWLQNIVKLIWQLFTYSQLTINYFIYIKYYLGQDTLLFFSFFSKKHIFHCLFFKQWQVIITLPFHHNKKFFFQSNFQFCCKKITQLNDFSYHSINSLAFSVKNSWKQNL